MKIDVSDFYNLNAACAGYNEIADRQGWIKIPGSVDRIMREGSLEDADGAVCSLLAAANTFAEYAALLYRIGCAAYAERKDQFDSDDGDAKSYRDGCSDEIEQHVCTLREVRKGL